MKVFGDLRQAEVMRLRSEAVREGIRRSYKAAFKHLRVLGKSPSGRCERIVQPGDRGAGISATCREPVRRLPCPAGLDLQSLRQHLRKRSRFIITLILTVGMSWFLDRTSRVG